MCSPNAVAPNGTPCPRIVRVLKETRDQGNPVGIISNHNEPNWFREYFNETEVQFLKVPGRQDGKIISLNSEKLSLMPHDTLVLAVKPDDVQMGKNGGAVLIAAGWSNDQTVRNLGIYVRDIEEFKEIIKLTSEWTGQWWFYGNQRNYSIRSLADLSQYNKSITQQEFAEKLKKTVKNGGINLTALLTVTARSLLSDGLGNKKELVWGVYPSSNSENHDNEILSDFTHRLRTTVSRVHFSKRGEPLFIRHTPSHKRSTGGGGDRKDPSNQIETIYLNPFYKSRLNGKHVILIDDCTTYGVSFGVASSLLRRAGVATVTGVALGKFGNQLRYYNIDIISDPFRPIPLSGYNVVASNKFSGAYDRSTQQNLQSLIP